MSSCKLEVDISRLPGIPASNTSKPIKTSTVTVIMPQMFKSPKNTGYMCNRPCIDHHNTSTAIETVQKCLGTKHKHTLVQPSTISLSQGQTVGQTPAPIILVDFRDGAPGFQARRLPIVSPFDSQPSVSRHNALSISPKVTGVTFKLSHPDIEQKPKDPNHHRANVSLVVALGTVAAVVAVLIGVFLVIRRKHTKADWREDLEAPVPKDVSHREVIEEAIRRRKIRRALYDAQNKKEEGAQKTGGSKRSMAVRNGQPYRENDSFDLVAFAHLDVWNEVMVGDVPRRLVQIRHARSEEALQGQILNVGDRERSFCPSRDRFVSALNADGSVDGSCGIHNVSLPDSSKRSYHGWPR